MTITTSLTSDIGKVRLQIGDDGSTGVLPDGTNLSDDQVTYYLTAEGSVMRSVAGICEMLATRYVQLVDLAVGPRRESMSQIAKGYADRAKALRARFGGQGMGAYAAGVKRQGDGYGVEPEPSDELANAGGTSGETGLSEYWTWPTPPGVW